MFGKRILGLKEVITEPNLLYQRQIYSVCNFKGKGCIGTAVSPTLSLPLGEGAYGLNAETCSSPAWLDAYLTKPSEPKYWIHLKLWLLPLSSMCCMIFYRDWDTSRRTTYLLKHEIFKSLHLINYFDEDQRSGATLKKRLDPEPHWKWCGSSTLLKSNCR